MLYQEQSQTFAAIYLKADGKSSLRIDMIRIRCLSTLGANIEDNGNALALSTLIGNAGCAGDQR